MAHDPFLQLAQYLRQHAGINLVDNEKNRVLVSSRLQKVLPKLGAADLNAFLGLLQRGGNTAHDEFVNAMTTNTTHFWREAKHFEHLKNTLPELAAKIKTEGRKELRVWCAASSSGEEPYTLAMLCHKILGSHSGLQIQVLATDIDTLILAKAMNAVYSLDSIAALPVDLKSQYFITGKGQSDQFVKVKSDIRKLVTFAQFNLISNAYTFKKHFDIIFCRNVMIYFTREDIGKIVMNMQNVIYPGGLLYVGHSETLMGIPHNFKSTQPAVYQLQKNVLSKGEAA